MFRHMLYLRSLNHFVSISSELFVRYWNIVTAQLEHSDPCVEAS
jgi:hypothetical protein